MVQSVCEIRYQGYDQQLARLCGGNVTYSTINTLRNRGCVFMETTVIRLCVAAPPQNNRLFGDHIGHLLREEEVCFFEASDAA